MRESLFTVKKPRFDDMVLFLYFIIMYAHNTPYPRLFSICSIIFAGYFIARLFFLEKGLLQCKKYFVLMWYVIFLLYEVYAASRFPQFRAEERITEIQNVLLLIGLCSYVSDRESYLRLLKVFAYSATYFAAVCLITSPISTYGTLQFGGITLVQRNTIAYVVGVAFLYFIIFGLYEQRNFYYILAAVCAVATIMTGSRKGIIQLLIPFLLLIVMQENLKKKIKAFALVGCLGLIVLVVCLNTPIIMETYGTRLLEVFSDESKDASVIARGQLSDFGIGFFLQNPVFGYGLKASVKLTEAYGFGIVNYLHQNYVELLVSGGIIGFVLYSAPIAWAGIMTWINRKYNMLSKFLFCLVVTYFVLGTGQVTLYFAQFYPIIFMIIAGIKYLYDEEVK